MRYILGWFGLLYHRCGGFAGFGGVCLLVWFLGGCLIVNFGCLLFCGFL